MFKVVSCLVFLTSSTRKVTLNCELMFETWPCVKDVESRVSCSVYLNSSTRQVVLNHELTFETRYKDFLGLVLGLQ